MWGRWLATRSPCVCVCCACVSIATARELREQAERASAYTASADELGERAHRRRRRRVAAIGWWWCDALRWRACCLQLVDVVGIQSTVWIWNRQTADRVCVYPCTRRAFATRRFRRCVCVSNCVCSCVCVNKPRVCVYRRHHTQIYSIPTLSELVCCSHSRAYTLEVWSVVCFYFFCVCVVWRCCTREMCVRVLDVCALVQYVFGQVVECALVTVPKYMRCIVERDRVEPFEHGRIETTYALCMCVFGRVYVDVKAPRNQYRSSIVCVWVRVYLSHCLHSHTHTHTR